MVEAIIVIPVLILIWVSLYYVGDLFSTRQELEATARSCAWLYSAGNCQVVPPGCERILTDSSSSAPVAPPVEDALADGARRALEGGDTQGVVGTILGDLVAGPLTAAFTSSVDARATRDLKQPASYGGGFKQVNGRYHLACNLDPTSPEEMASKAWSSLVKP